MTPSPRGLLAAYGAFGVFWGGWGALLPAVKAQTAATEAQLGLAMLCIAAAAAPALLVMGRVFDRLGTQTVAPALVAFAAAAVLPGLAHSVAALSATLVVLGVASGALDVAVNSGVSAFEAEHGQRLMNKAHAAFPLGALIASVSVGLAREAGAAPLAILAGMGAAIALVALLNRGARRPARPADRPRSRFRLTPPLLALGALLALASLIENGLEQWSALHLEDTLGAPPAVSALGPGVFSAALFAGRALAQARGQGVPPVTVIAASGLVSAAGVGIAAGAPNAPLALLGLGFGGTGLALAAPAILGLAGRHGGEALRGSAVALVTTIGYVAYLAGPALIGAMAGAAGLRVALAGLAVTGLLLAAGAPLVRGRVAAPAGG